MSKFYSIDIILALAALMAYLNHRFWKLPMTIALMGQALILSLIFMGIGLVFPSSLSFLQEIMTQVDFSSLLMDGMLAVLLFAGALHVNLDDLAEKKLPISVFATAGVAGSTFMVAAGMWAICHVLGMTMPFIYCLIFGALISPTDPIAVLGIMKRSGAPMSLQTKLAGESLFNDGIGVVLFMAFLAHATGGEGNFIVHFLQEVVGGVVMGLVCGYVAFRMLRSINDYKVEILITIALASGCYGLGHSLAVSGPIAVVTAGLLIGNQGRRLAMSEKTRLHLFEFWEMLDELLNAILFVLIGMEVLVVTLNGKYLLAGLLAIPLLLVARLIAIAVPVGLLRKRHDFSQGAIKILTWGGLRGGLSVALAMSLPILSTSPAGTGTEPDIAEFPARQLILSMTYIVAAFSILVQGTTINVLIKKTLNLQSN